MAAGQESYSATDRPAEQLAFIAERARKLDQRGQSIAIGCNEQTQGMTLIASAANVITRGVQPNSANAAAGVGRAQQFNVQAQSLSRLAAEIDEIFRTGDRTEVER